MHQIPTCMKEMCSWLHFQTLPARIIIALDAVAPSPRSSLPGPYTRFLRLGLLAAVAQSCLLPRGTPFIQREPPHLAPSEAAVLSPWGQTSTMTYWYRNPGFLASLEPLINRAHCETKWKLGFGWTPPLCLALPLALVCVPHSLVGFRQEHSPPHHIKWMGRAYPQVLSTKSNPRQLGAIY